MPRKSGLDDNLAAIDLSGFEPVSVPRLSDTIADRIRSFITAQDLAPGTRLPSERVLADAFGASRPTVSQALRTLSLMGIIESRRGSGAYVLRRPTDTEAPQLWRASDENLDHLLQLRLWLESLGVREAVNRTRKGRAREVRAALDRMIDSMVEPAAWIAADTVFHATLVGLAVNPNLTAIYEQVHTALLEYEYEYWVESDQVPEWLSPSSSHEILALHTPIVDALEQRDEAAALAAVQHHSNVMGDHVRQRALAPGERLVGRGQRTG